LLPLQDDDPPPARLWVRLSDVAPKAPTLAAARLELSPELEALLAGYHEVVAARLHGSTSPSAFLLELQAILRRLAVGRSTGGRSSCNGDSDSDHRHLAASAYRGPAFYESLCSQLEHLGWGCIADLAEDLSSLTLRLADARGRPHELRLTLPPEFPAAPPLVVSADLPAPLPPPPPAAPKAPATSGNSSLGEAVARFEAALAQHQLLWDELDDLDAHAWVLEPQQPTRAGLMRRVALGNHVSLEVHVCVRACVGACVRACVRD
jgi:E3 ubiquitin-protein ligase FANCL